MSKTSKPDKETVTFNSRNYEWVGGDIGWPYCILNEPLFCLEDSRYYVVLNFYPNVGTIFMAPASIVLIEKSKKKGFKYTIEEDDEYEPRDVTVKDFKSNFMICMGTKDVEGIYFQEDSINNHKPMFVSMEGESVGGL